LALHPSRKCVLPSVIPSPFNPENPGLPKIVLIRGILTPALAFARLAPILAAVGYHVLIYDLYGRGYSDAPQGAYGAHLYIIQLALLLQHLRWSCVRVAGFSMGGAIAAAFVAAFPALVERDVVLIASAGAPEVRVSVSSRCLRRFLVPTLI
jgi:pimeloyl-ACP methyl ester carboxylesterase